MKILCGRFAHGLRACVSWLVVGLALTGVSPSVGAQLAPEKVDLAALDRIRAEELSHSQVMEMVGYLTDVTGPRLTGSANLRRAQEYAAGRLREWGVTNVHLEAWGPFGRGWSLEGFTANMLAPAFTPLIAYPKAWSPGTRGPVRGEVVFLDVNTPADLDKYRGKLRGKIVLLSPARPVAPNFLPPAERTTDEELLKLAAATPTPDGPQQQMSAERRARLELNYRKWQMLYQEGAAVVLEPGAGDAGTVYVTAASVPAPPDAPAEARPRPWALDKPAVLPQVVVAAEQYNRMIRLAARGIPVRLEVNIAARFHDDDPMSYNVVGEIAGSDLKDEVVMLGGCLDSWHTGTGATDNAAGAAVALEVMRLIKALDLKPRRTVRIGLWSAEEQGALGSRAYVAAHFARRVAGAGGAAGRTRLALTPEHEKFSGYFNLDYGTGRIRGVYLQGNEAVRPVFSAWLAPFKDMGAGTLTIAGIGATDHNSFDDVGLPGFQFLRDFMETNPRTAHTNMDVYEHVLADDLKQSAVVAAAFIYQAAMRDERLPRKPLPAAR